MAIYSRCSQCRKDNPVTEKVCSRCNSRLGDKYQVKIRDNLSGKWKTKTTVSLKSAKAIEAKLKVQMIEGKLFDHKKRVGSISFASFLSHAKLNKKSWKTDQWRWDKHIAGRDFTTRKGICQILKDQQEAGYAPATVHHTLKLIRRVYNWHIENGMFHGENPCNRIKVPKYDNRVNSILSAEQVITLTDHLISWNNRRAALVILFALYSGRRKGEILSLTWSDIDWENSAINCRDTKNGDSLSFPVNQKCLDVLHEARSLMISDLVFPCSTGKYFHIDKTWQTLRKKLKLSIRFHDLRHTYASHLASSGQVDIYTLKTLLGHKDIKLTERYSHLSNERLRRSTEVLDTLF